MRKIDEQKLMKAGFVEETVEEVIGSLWVKDDWEIIVSKEEVDDLVEAFDEGCRVCLMNKPGKLDNIVVHNMCDDGYWFTSTITKALKIVKVEGGL